MIKYVFIVVWNIFVCLGPFCWRVLSDCAIMELEPCGMTSLRQANVGKWYEKYSFHLIEFTNGYEMMHKAWSSIEEVPYCFFKVICQILRSQGTKKTLILTQIWRFWTVTPVWIQWSLWNDVQSLKQHRIGALLFFKVICRISSSHGTKNCRFWPELSVSGL